MTAPAGLLAQARRRSPTVLFAPTGNLQNPGARSFALGGAFIALADDASAAELNPAGLTQLKRPEISLEYRGLESVVPVEYTGATSAGNFDCLAGFGIDGPPCVNDGTTEEDSLSFVSLIVPASRNLTWALYRHELARERFSIVRPAFTSPESHVPGSIQSLDRRLVRTGLSLAWAPSSVLSVGATANLNSMTQDFKVVEYSTALVPGEQFGGPPAYLWVIQENSIDDQKLGGTAGLLWRPTQALSVGISYSTRVRFEEDAVVSFCIGRAGGAPDCRFQPGSPAPHPDNLYQRIELPSERRPTFTLPSRGGVSLAVRPTSWLVLVAEGDRVTYSENDIITTRFDPDTGDVIGEDRLTADDVWELHAGAEAVVPFAARGLIALRAGFWKDPDHSFRYDRCRAVAGVDCAPDGFFTLTHPPTGDLDHYTGGIGIAWAWGQLDVGYDWVRQTEVGTVSASFVLRAK